jgi:hypothetical protein
VSNLRDLFVRMKGDLRSLGAFGDWTQLAAQPGQVPSSPPFGFHFFHTSVGDTDRVVIDGTGNVLFGDLSIAPFGRYPFLTSADLVAAFGPPERVIDNPSNANGRAYAYPSRGVSAVASTGFSREPLPDGEQPLTKLQVFEPMPPEDYSQTGITANADDSRCCRPRLAEARLR